MNTLKLLIFLFFLCLLSCQNGKETETINLSLFDEDFTQLSLSKIAEDITAVELEATDSSFIGFWQQGYGVFPLREYIVFYESSMRAEQILLFNSKGKFIRTIGRKGQGPGEFVSIRKLAVNEQRQLIYVLTNQKIICYSFKGQLVKEKALKMDFVEHIHQYKDELLLLVTTIGNSGYNRTMCYKIDKNLTITDSLLVQREKREGRSGIMVPTVSEPFSLSKEHIYFHRPKFFSPHLTSDTLLEIKGKELIPSAIFTFEEEKKNTPIYIFRSSRFICMLYGLFGQHLYFCYDIKTGEKYYLQGGYTDDICTGESVRIRPFPHDSERFYYLHTNIKDTDRDEPNPTLYIGRFKQ